MIKTIKKIKPAFWVLAVLLFMALARDFLANGQPLYCRIGGEAFWPGLRKIWVSTDIPFKHPVLDSIRINGLWRTFPYDAAVFAPVPFSPGEIERHPLMVLAKPGEVHTGLPGRFRHWLGTDDSGRDVAAGLVSGARISIQTGLAAMSMAVGIGLILGALAGFFGDDHLRVRQGRLWGTVLGLPVAWFYAFIARQYALGQEGGQYEWVISALLFTGILIAFNLLGAVFAKIPVLGKTVAVPADLLIMRLAELFMSIPKLIFIIVVAALSPKGQSIWLMIMLLGLMSWTAPARFVRAELLRIRELDYIAAARGLGFSEWRVLLRHALPNAIGPTLIVFAIGVGEAIVLEASLSFLGFGGGELMGKSWGTLLNSARSAPTAWWISLPPGLSICLVVLSLNVIGESLATRKDA